MPDLSAAFTAFLATSIGEFPIGSSWWTGTFNSRPNWTSWSMAAGRWRSQAASMAGWLSLRRRSASLAAVVVLPEPCSPTSMMTDGGDLARCRPTASPPSISRSSSWTIFTTVWPGDREENTRSPSARSLTLLTNCRVDPEVDVGFEQRHAHVPHSGVHVLVGETPFAGEAR